MKRKGSALLMSLVTIAVLSVLVISFVYEARQQAGINVYVRERNRVNRLVEAGQALGEIVLLKYSDVADWNEDQDTDKLLEDDRWRVEKQDLKSYSKCTIGPILLDETRDKDGELVNPSTVKVELQSVNSGETGIININELYNGANDSKYMERWWMIFQSHNIPEELSTEKDGVINLWNMLIASWDDWRDQDDTVTAIDGEECGAESKWYEEYEEDNHIDEEDRKRPRNGRIPDVHELAYLRGWREYPQVLTGGVINPWEHKDNQITVRGLEDLFCTEGSSKININSCKSLDVLVTIPGIFADPERDDAMDEAKVVAQAILDGLSAEPVHRDDYDRNRTWWPYKDWSDLIDRVDEDIGNEAGNYLAYSTDVATTVFKMKITCESKGMTRIVQAECYVKDKKVRYISWRED